MKVHDWRTTTRDSKSRTPSGDIGTRTGLELKEGCVSSIDILDPDGGVPLRLNISIGGPERNWYVDVVSLDHSVMTVATWHEGTPTLYQDVPERLVCVMKKLAK